MEQTAYINKLFQAFAIKYTKEELMFQAQEKGVQVAKVLNVRDAMEDPHLRQRGYFVKVEHPELNDAIAYTGAPFKSDEMSWKYWRRAPFIGEHNQEIYMEELGISDERSKEEVERDRKECEKITYRNEKVYRLLLGE